MWARRAMIVALGMVGVFLGTPAQALAQDSAQTTRMFFGPTGRTLPQGDVYIGAYALLMPFVQVGVTDSVTVGASAPIVPYLMMRGMGSSNALPFVATAKARVFHQPKSSVAAGAIHFSAGGGSHAGLAYVVGTRDTATGSATLGAGCGYSDSGSGPGCTLVLTAGGSHRVSRRTSLISENHLFVGHTALLTGGVRRTSGRFSIDYGMVLAVGSGSSPALFINVAYRVGGR